MHSPNILFSGYSYLDYFLNKDTLWLSICDAFTLFYNHWLEGLQHNGFLSPTGRLS